MAPFKGIANVLRSISHSALRSRRTSYQGPPVLEEVDEESPHHMDEVEAANEESPTQQEAHQVALESVRIEEIPKTPSTASSSLKYNFQDPNGPLGQLYRGEFKDSKKHGSGAMSFSQTDHEGRFMYHGDFFEDKMHGSGTLDWHDGKKYKGQFAVNKLHGEGVMCWADGRKYVGHYFEGRKHGLGTVQYPDGSSYCGTFAKGKMHGEIVYTSKHGIAKLIRFREGKPIQVTLIGSNSEDSPASVSSGREDSICVPSDATTETGSVCSGARSLTASGTGESGGMIPL